MDLNRQLDEMEALRAMYPAEEGCFVLSPSEQEAMESAAAAVAAGPDSDPVGLPIHTLSGTVRLPGVLLEQQPVSLRFQLPPGYPSVEAPLVSVECSCSRHTHEQLSSAVRQAVEAAVGSESLLLALGALQEAAEAAATTTAAAAAAAAASQTGVAMQPGVQQQGLAVDRTATGSSAHQQQQAQECSTLHAGGQTGNSGHEATPPAALRGSPGGSSSSTCPHDVLQVVIWFHHIKSTEKRKNIVAWARELDCCGYSKPGFPGIVVVEGLEADVREFVGRVRALQWQAMQVRAEQHVCCAACSSSSAVGLEHARGLDPPAAAAASRSLSNRFTELPETGMSDLSLACKAAGLEDLFLAALKLSR